MFPGQCMVTVFKCQQMSLRLYMWLTASLFLRAVVMFFHIVNMFAVFWTDLVTGIWINQNQHSASKCMSLINYVCVCV